MYIFMIGCSMILRISIKIIMWFIADNFFRTNLSQTQVSEWAVKLLITNLNAAVSNESIFNSPIIGTTKIWKTVWFKSFQPTLSYAAQMILGEEI